MPDYISLVGGPAFDPLGDFAAGRKTRDELNAMKRMDAERPLMGQALQGDQNALRQLGGIDPQSYMEVQKAHNDQTMFGNRQTEFKQGQEDRTHNLKLKQLDEISGLLNWADTPEKWAQAVAHLDQQGHPLDPQERDFNNRPMLLAQSQTLKEQLAQENAQQKAENGGGGGYGLQPIVTQDPQTGQYHLYQAAKDGGPPQEIQLPYGWTPKNQFLDTGTGYQPTPVQGNPQTTMQPIPKNNAEEAAAKAVGKSQGEAKALYQSLESKMPELERVVENLNTLADSATYTMAGKVENFARKEIGLDPKQGAIDRTSYISTVDNVVLPMLRDTFGAAFTQKEGDSLKVTLGDPNLTPAEKKAVLKVFIKQKKRDLQALATQTGADQPQDGAAPSLKSKYGLE